jgi:hypothetical protein
MTAESLYPLSSLLGIAVSLRVKSTPWLTERGKEEGKQSLGREMRCSPVDRDAAVWMEPEPQIPQKGVTFHCFIPCNPVRIREV